MIVAASALWLASAAPVFDPVWLEAEVERVVEEHLEQTEVPGVLVAVVAGGEIVLSRGFGLADVETQRPMDPATTLVRIASLSKTFTATAVAQLEDEGRLDIDADVDAYLLRVQTGGAFAEPVTLRHLLAHTAGYINFNSGRVFLEPRRWQDFEAFMVATMPPRLFPPGTASLYTNHGNALAALVVQDVVGVPYHDYVQERILDPLGMTSTTYAIDPDHPELAKSYRVNEGEVTPWRYEHYGTVPASSLHSTADDMARWLVMHAGDGTFQGATVLSAAAIERMRTPHATIHPALPEHHYAFAPVRVRGHAGRSHGGSVPAFLSRMTVFDAQGVGVFVVQNAFGPDVCPAVIAAVAAALPEAEPDLITPIADGRPEDPDALVGDYRVADKYETAAFTRPRALLSQPPVRIRVDDDGFLRVDGRRFERVDELVFQAYRARHANEDERVQEETAIETVVFVRGEDGAIAWVHRDRNSAHRPPWHARRELQIGAYALALVLLVAGLVGLRRRTLTRRGPWAAIAIASLLGTIVPHAFAIIVDAGHPVYVQPFRLGTPQWITLCLWLPRAAAIVGALLLAMRSFRHRPAIAIAIGAALLLLLELYWRTPPPGLPAA